jgi:hypothetical protein
MTSIPFIALQAARPARLLDLLVAREKGECICRSAMYLMLQQYAPEIFPLPFIVSSLFMA